MGDDLLSRSQSRLSSDGVGSTRLAWHRIAPVVAAVGIVAGVPHGAMDHLVPGLMSRRWQSTHAAASGRRCLRRDGRSGECWLHCGSPTSALPTFLVVSAIHFGWAERHTPPSAAATRSRGCATAGSTRLAHGAVVVVLPLWSAEGQVRDAAALPAPRRLGGCGPDAAGPPARSSLPAPPRRWHLVPPGASSRRSSWSPS